MSKREIYRKMPVEALNLTPRTRNAIRRGGIETIGGLFGKTLGELLDLHALGASCAGELIEKAFEMDLEQRVTILEACMDKLLEEKK